MEARRTPTRAGDNGELLHAGQWRWNPAQGSDGRIRPERRQLSARLRPGPNHFLGEVAADEPFGWVRLPLHKRGRCERPSGRLGRHPAAQFFGTGPAAGGVPLLLRTGTG